MKPCYRTRSWQRVVTLYQFLEIYGVRGLDIMSLSPRYTGKAILPFSPQKILMQPWQVWSHTIIIMISIYGGPDAIGVGKIIIHMSAVIFSKNSWKCPLKKKTQVFLQLSVFTCAHIQTRSRSDSYRKWAECPGISHPQLSFPQSILTSMPMLRFCK